MMSPRRRVLVAVCAVLMACSLAAARAAEPPITQSASSAAQKALPSPTPLPIFLTDTYVCEVDVSENCGQNTYSCFVTCNVGQSCRCNFRWGLDANGCAYVQAVTFRSCF